MKPSFEIPSIDPTLIPKLQQAIDQKTKPRGALGRLESLALQLGLLQNRLDPAVDHPHCLLFAADHGVTRCHSVSAYPREVTAQMVRNFLVGGAAINVFCQLLAVPLTVVDAGVDADLPPHPHLISAKLARGSADFTAQPALGESLATAAIAHGAALSDAIKPLNLLIVGEMGIGNTASASLILHLLTQIPLDELVGAGTGLDADGIARKRAVLERALERGGRSDDPWQILAEYGGLEIAMMVGAILAAARRRVAILIDGFIATAAAAVARAIAPSLDPYLIYAHCSAEAGHRKVLAALNAHPLLDLQMRLGEGTGAVLAFPILKAACAFLNQMATFADAGVSDRAPLP
ncbi:MAG: nicotinate-nucleotide--dimethylbenzimidazole phosphoribosyltransferase [Hydrogenophilus sp.]|nr:nicotinate-nucleotide--dimethylbenzimidazole phosphoribosyltransferase [Hydrogenophilus sp.]